MAKASFDSKEVKKVVPKTLFIELVDQRDSGWVMDGTAGTKQEVRLTSPSARFIANRGYRLAKNADGDWVNEPIRYIKNCPTLSVEEQNRRGFRPAKNKQEDLIIVKNGNLTVTREGKFTALYDYLEQVFYNVSNSDRPSSAQDIFRVVDLGAKEEKLNEAMLAEADAIQFIGSLYAKQGKEYVYEEEKINALCQVFLVYAETPSGKISGLMAYAKRDPKDFMSKALKFEQTITMEIGHALDLGLILFKGNVASYATKDKAITSFGQGNIKHDKKVERLASFFGSSEGTGAYEEFKVELAAMKEKKFDN